VAVEITPLEQLPRWVNRKATVDLCGVMTAVGLLGSIKRKVGGGARGARAVGRERRAAG
jgi:hypothetical protein